MFELIRGKLEFNIYEYKNIENPEKLYIAVDIIGSY